jgi:uncharacterized membrane protein
LFDNRQTGWATIAPWKIKAFPLIANLALHLIVGCRSMQATRMSNLVFRFATVQGRNIQWFLRRNCSVTPAQLATVYLSLCLVSMVISGFFWIQGATLVLPYAFLEMLMLGAAFLVYARHATDGERIVLQDGRLLVELECGGKLERSEFLGNWVRVEPGAYDKSLIELTGQGKTVRVGRFVRPELRPALAREIRQALRMV